jgi:phosphatidylglycerophosphatase A
MPVKESSDELNPPVRVADAAIGPAERTRNAKDHLALAIATCGVGYIPLAPGTWGSLLGIGLYLLLRWATRLVPSFAGVNSFLLYDPGTVFLATELVVITLVTLIGVWAASRVERLEGKKDPGKVVIDEVAGQLIALLPVPLLASAPWRLWIIIGFFLFRAFDIVKPYPVRQLEALPSGLGIVVDDLGAGAYAAVVLSILISLFMIFA